MPADWRWPQDFIHNLVRWARALAWMPGPAEVSGAELALDYEAFVGLVLAPLRTTGCGAHAYHWGNEPKILHKAVGLAERRLAAGALLGGAPLGRVRGAFGSAILCGAPRGHVAADALATHCRDSWGRRLRASARMRPQHSDRFLMDYFHRSLDGGPPLLLYAQRPPRAPARSVPLAAPQRSRPPGAGSGTVGTLCLKHGAASCARCRSLGWGISCCCGAGHEGHAAWPVTTPARKTGKSP